MGGVNVGFCKVAYHVGIEARVNAEPTIPANWQTRIETMSLEILAIFIKLGLPSSLHHALVSLPSVPNV